MRLPRVRFRLQWIMVVAALVAVVLSMLAPELRDLGDESKRVLAATAVVAAYLSLCFLPWWLALAALHRRSRRGSKVGYAGYALLIGGFLASLVVVAVTSYVIERLRFG